MPKSIPSLTVFSFHPVFEIEAYLYEENNACDSHLFALTIRVGEVPSERDRELKEFNIYRIDDRRLPFSLSNSTMVNKNIKPMGSRHRRVIVRRLPRGTKSTYETRLYGLKQLQGFLLMRRLDTHDQPDGILLRDLTKPHDPWALNVLFLDKAIKSLMEEFLMELNENFYSKHNEIARKCWSGIVRYKWAAALGFPE